MINYTEIENFEEQIQPGRIYRYQVGIEVPLPNLSVLDKMLEYLDQRMRQKLDLQSLRIEKIRILEGEPSEIFIYFSVNRSEARSVWTTWKVIEQELAPIGKVAKLLSAYSQAPQLPANLGQPPLAAVIKRFLYDWHAVIEILLLVVIILILLEKKQ